MRVPNNSLNSLLTTQLEKLSARQAELQGQAASGQRITVPSDDPASMGRVLHIQAEKQQIHQFARNTVRAHEITQASYSGVDQLKKISDRVGELAVLGAGATGPDAYDAYAKEVNQLLEQALRVTNTKYNGEYLFGGTRSDSAPFSATRNAAGEISNVAYVGSSSSAKIRISEDGVIAPFTSGADNQGFGDFLNQLATLRDALAAHNAAAVHAAGPGLETSESHLLVTISDIGAKQTRIEADDSQNQARFQELDSMMGHETDSDLAQTIVKLTQTQNSYQAALQTGAKMLQLSLLDYVR